MMLSPAERETIERLLAVAEGRADHEFYDDRESDEEAYARDPSKWDYADTSTERHWEPEIEKLSKLARELK